jgi:hypothetical protein
MTAATCSFLLVQDLHPNFQCFPASCAFIAQWEHFCSAMSFGKELQQNMISKNINKA